MAKYKINIDDELINYFRENFFDAEPAEKMIVKMLKLLRELLEIAK